MQWKVIEISDGPIGTLDEIIELKRGKIGELLVSGPMVTRGYVTRLDQNELHKVIDGDAVWHRMGDVGYFDSKDRFWFCGRKAHRVVAGERTYFTIPCEAIFNAHPRVEKSALVGRGPAGQKTPVIVVQPSDPSLANNLTERENLIAELRDLAMRNPLTQRIDQFVIRENPLPVDIRHNSKIFREKLSAEIERVTR